MRPGAVIATGTLTVLWLAAWHSQLFTVSRPGEAPRALEIRAVRATVSGLDVVLPAIPIGMQRVRAGDGALLIHYWAPWERHGLSQAAQLDSLRRSEGMEGVRVVVVCFDPFPSVARFVARNRLRLRVLLDGRHELSRALPCPSIPYTYVIDRAGRLAVDQPGEVDWLSPVTRAALLRLGGERDSSAVAPPVRPSSST
jgi:hypothetical protein